MGEGERGMASGKGKGGWLWWGESRGLARDVTREGGEGRVGRGGETVMERAAENSVEEGGGGGSSVV